VRKNGIWYVVIRHRGGCEMKYLLGYPNVKNYDGSWTEWGNSIANPIEK